ncbi:FG-GAP repeat domain-containing protein [Pelagimonas varians]|uniref:FG-GAP repeat protein n=1 Tax=Pelagimonas varians TaxID=696760 RepID=A0A238KY34_9RHOB|nr:VCBS repeat-containing protein [Pelagimonas varians]PYG27776.1 hypothetical protein C8N36_11452 [Pelagimonas varians]SMX47481.1 hypothetical protein PEV8663_03551 [Pelagimonas varians]
MDAFRIWAAMPLARRAKRVLKRAPRLPLRPLVGLTGGASLVVSLCLAGAVAAEISTARFADPTTRYQHGVLGDAVEWGALKVGVKGKTITFTLPQSLVFEDIAPRLVDVDGASGPEIVVVESHQDKGARLAVWNEGGRVASTPFIGRRNRWLAPIGAADLDGDGHVEIAYVDRPHLAKTLRVWRFKDGNLSEVASEPGFSNHQIGWDYIQGGIRDCGLGHEMIVASGDWQNVMAVRFEAGQLQSKTLSRYSPKAITQAMSCPK